ncbi:MAG: WecB/TagA/CpsF family glycosyltransferase [Ruminococcaceae bacterium]|nr:WecB/TagA/CpsF family glycosyltransferase [Oscillospiraceae bacterium]
MANYEKINIRGVNFLNVTLDEAAKVGEEMLRGDKVCTVFTPNAEIVQLCIEQNEYYDLYNSGDMVVADGAGVVKAAKILKTPVKGKVAGVELGEKMLAHCANSGDGVFFLGAKPGVADEAAKKMAEKYKGLRVVGTNDGYFKKEGEESDAVIAKINESGAKLLFVCLGVPVQEKWITDNKEKLTSARMCMCLGGSLDVYAGTAKRAPKIFIKLSCEWLYRLLKEPWRLGRMMKLPKFLFGTYAYKFKKKK